MVAEVICIKRFVACVSASAFGHVGWPYTCYGWRTVKRGASTCSLNWDLTLCSAFFIALIVSADGFAHVVLMETLNYSSTIIFIPLGQIYGVKSTLCLIPG